MGAPKRDHIRVMLVEPHVAAQWRDRHGRIPTEGDIDEVYHVLVPMNEEVVADYAELIPGAAETVRWLRARGIRIGSTTGYTPSTMDRVLPVAAAQGYVPDNLVCGADLAEGRPGSRRWIRLRRQDSKGGERTFDMQSKIRLADKKRTLHGSSSPF